MKITKTHGAAFRQKQASGIRWSQSVTLEDGTKCHVSAVTPSKLRAALIARGISKEIAAELCPAPVSR